MKTAIQTREAPAAIGTYSQAVKVGGEAGGSTVYLSGQIGLDPATMQMALSQRPDIALRSSMPSMSMLLPRETSRPSKPAASAPPTASPKATLQATLPNGSNVHNHV